MSERAMATIRRIDKIEPIPNADKIVLARVGGWQLVTAIANGFKEGDLVVYCEIDSWIPTEVAPFLTKPGHTPKEYNGVKGEKLRTIRLRGQISQGLLLPCSIIPNFVEMMSDLEMVLGTAGAEEEIQKFDVSELLNIQKWEAPIPAQLAGTMKGNFPTQIPKTDQERIQNIHREFYEYKQEGLSFEVTEKLEGSSMTCYLIDGVFGVCSRNIDLVRDENNSFWKQAIADDIEDKMRLIGVNFALQGELVGEGIQGNIYGLKGTYFYIYDVYDITNGEYLQPHDRRRVVNAMMLNHVPVLQPDFVLENETPASLLALADGKTDLYPADVLREGIVFKCNEKDVSFKAVSNLYLEGEK